jgi:hypothetical protein
VAGCASTIGRVSGVRSGLNLLKGYTICGVYPTAGAIRLMMNHKTSIISRQEWERPLALVVSDELLQHEAAQDFVELPKVQSTVVNAIM